MPSSVVCRCLFRLMRRYFLGRWICLLVSERLRLVWQCCPFGCNTYIYFCVHWHGGQCQLRLVPDYAVVSLLDYAYSPVTPSHQRSRRLWLFCGVPFASSLSQLEAIFSDFVHRSPKQKISMTNNLSITVLAFVLMSFSVDETLLLK